MDRYGRPYFYHRLIFPREQSRAGRLINGPRRRIYSGSRGQINSGVHVVKSVVTTTREHQPLSERLVTRRGGDGGVQGHRPRNDRPAVDAAPGIQVDLLKIVVRSRYAARLYIAGGMSRSRGFELACYKRHRAVPAALAARQRAATKYGRLMQRFSNLHHSNPISLYRSSSGKRRFFSQRGIRAIESIPQHFSVYL